MDEHVNAAVTIDQMLCDALRRVVGCDIDLQCGTAKSVGDLSQSRALRGHIGDDDRGPVPRERLGDGGANPSGGASDHGDSIFKRVLPVLSRNRFGRSNADDLTVHIG